MTRTDKIVMIALALYAALAAAFCTWVHGERTRVYLRVDDLHYVPQTAPGGPAFDLVVTRTDALPFSRQVDDCHWSVHWYDPGADGAVYGDGKVLHGALPLGTPTHVRLPLDEQKLASLARRTTYSSSTVTPDTMRVGASCVSFMLPSVERVFPLTDLPPRAE
jgi:hypothetical protein